MRQLIWLAVLAVLVALVLLFFAKRRGSSESRPKPTAKTPLTEREQPMFFRLAEAFPQHVVLAQVAFSALLDSPNRATRNTFDRKVADFVLCTKGFSVVAVIELDDSTHRGREGRDRDRDELLRRAGYTVLRYKAVPSADRLRADTRTQDLPATTRPPATL